MSAEHVFQRWQGLAASPGLIIGEAHVVRTEADLATCAEGAILVARHATPTLFPSLVRARAAVCETGGRLSHLAVLARELGKPCVTGLAGIVTAVTSGVRLRVDGSSGVVEALTPLDRLPAAPGVATGADASPPAMRPVLQFGHFSSAFEYRQSAVDLETVVRLAALVGLPLALGGDAGWPFAVVENRLLVDADALDRATLRVVDELDHGQLAMRLHTRYDVLCAWSGWTEPETAPLRAEWLGTALRSYVTLNQLTWIAGLTREPLTERYQAWLSERLAGLDAAARDRLVLDSLIMPDRSYILRRWLGEPAAATLWSAAGATSGGAETAAAQALASTARARRAAALTQLQIELSRADFARAETLLDVLAALVDLTERKNSDLYRRGLAIFGRPAVRRALVRLLTADAGPNPARIVSADQDAADWHRLVDHVLCRLRAVGGVSPIVDALAR